MGTNAPSIKHINVWFEEQISAYLRQYANEHEGWGVNLTKGNKNIIDCYNYIIMQTSKSHYDPSVDQTPCASEAEQFAWAVKYYEDDSIKNEDIVSPFKPKTAPTTTPTAPKAKKEDKKKGEQRLDFDFGDDEPKAESENKQVTITVKAEVSKPNEDSKPNNVVSLFDDDDL